MPNAPDAHSSSDKTPTDDQRQLPTSRQRFARFLKRWKEQPSSIQRNHQAELDAASQPTGYRKTALARYREWLWPRRWQIAAVLGLGIAGIGFDLAWPLVSKYLIDDVIMNDAIPTDERKQTILSIAAIMIGIFFTGSVLGFFKHVRMTLLTSRLAFDLRSFLYDRILRLPIDQVQALKTGGVISRVSGDVDATTGLVQNAFMNPITSTLRLLATLTVIFFLEWRIALSIMVIMPPIMFLHHRFIKRIRPIWRSISADRQEIDARVGESVGGLRVVRGFARERSERLAYAVGHHTIIRKHLLSARTHGAVNFVWGMMMPLASLTILCYGGYLVIEGQTTIGTLVAFQGYVWRLLEPVMQLVNAISETQRGLAAMERVFDLLDRAPERPDRPGAIAVPNTINAIEWQQVQFGYSSDRRILHDMSVTIPGGCTVALVGPSGAGKTTFTDLMGRFHDPSEGKILLNGVDLRDYQLQSYRSMLGIVQQDTFLFDGTVRENIRYPRRYASDADVESAAQRANADGFIRDLPKGYDTIIGERGVKLSGGQRQRLAIARSLLADPAILILDEATSSLDTESERLIQESLDTLLKGRTTFVIAHRLSTIAGADMILVIDGGRIIEHGTHADLMQKSGRYRDMVELQTTSIDEKWSASSTD